MITLKNKGVLDIDFIKLMGVNVKENDNAIGRFGTGLKYAIAVFIREKIDFEIYLGKNLFSFSKDSKKIRGKEFDICVMNGPHDQIDLPFTTELGKDWELWMAYRELYTNCVLDEDGECFNGMNKDRPLPEDGFTTINILSPIDTDDIFLKDREDTPIFESSHINIYEGESEFLYYQGIRAKKLSKKSKFTYNINFGCQLSEDRQISDMHTAGLILANCFVKMDDRDILDVILKDDDDYFENHINYSGVYVDPSQDFIESSNEVGSGFFVLNYIKRITAENNEQTLDERIDELEDRIGDLCSDLGFGYHFDLDSMTFKIFTND